MTTRVTFDFSRPATIAHNVGGVAEFDAVTEVGRAAASVGAGNAETRLVAGWLGDWANGIRYTTLPRQGAKARFEYDYGKGEVRGRSATTDDAGDYVKAFSSDPQDPRVNRVFPGESDFTAYMRLGKHPWAFRMDLGAGDGSSPADVGSTLLSGGAAPGRYSPNYAEYEAPANAGLFSFDGAEPLKLVQLLVALGGSVPWVVTLRMVADPSHGIPIASGTGQFVRVDTPALILPGFALGFEAASQGTAMCSVVRY